ncbi:MAG TPA: dihydrofolate reductase family protein [Candidatus Saccharimonadia bacterium]
MRIVLIAAQSADGFIAQTNDQLVNWSSQADKALFVRVTKELGTLVMGARTLATIGRALPGRHTIVMTHHPERMIVPKVETTAETPAELVARLEAAGTPGLAVCGGAEIYTQFMQAGLVQELYLVTEPLVFGQGLTLFNQPIVQRFELLDSEAKEGSVINHYRVKTEETAE